ncbi:type I-E CRISPR-associated protein Cse1/CasA [Lipingzhangella sp. LS1_29]|uniref:Type I-E CRISPR-associated protein Cse1/CasA n=1 Tax=Lipingzhangella rawalii TaxID=2055835 RepID=A0ABU2H3A8_9ACTN|nr:type I-E CRISPR-associated protein Cse1/CasA [Lipingzhangella rawalii]MDS1269788.1 type I-E CRISPR-associated protein Cse1/CasA [Lipingzhangella rawalii]
MPAPSFDLRTRPWLLTRPLGVGAEVKQLGLHDVLTHAHELADVEVPLPPATSGLWRLLAMLTARVTGLDTAENQDEWLERRGQLLRRGQLPEADIDTYFSRYDQRFDLFHPERPWMQDPRLRAECGKAAGVNKLVWGRPAGNNAVWLGHHVDADPAPVTSAEAAWSLVAWLYYGASGLCSRRVVGDTSKSNVTAGPIRRVVSFHPAGPSLFHSLVLNIPYPGDETEDTPAPWETQELPDPLGLPPSGEGLAGVLVSRYRHALLLEPSADGSEVTDAWITWAWRQPAPDVPDPYVIYDTSQAGAPYARRASADRAVWRDLDSLLRPNSRDGGARRPAILDLCGPSMDVPRDIRDQLTLRAFGFEQDGQTRDRQWFATATPPVLHWLTDAEAGAEPEATNQILQLRDAAEQSGRALRKALVNGWQKAMGVGEGEGPWVRHGLPRYWRRAEREFWRSAFAESTSGPGNTFIHLAVQVFEHVTEPYARRPRVAEALEQVRRGLYSGWVPPTPPPEEPQ